MTNPRILLLFLLLLPVLNKAACTLPSSTASFGTVTSFVVNTTISTTSANVNVNCGAGSALSLLGNNVITMQLTSASVTSGSRGALKRAGDTGPDAIPVRLCNDVACANEMLIGGTAYTYNQAQLVNLIGLLGGLNFTMPLYLRTVPGQTVAAGTYTVTLNVMVNYRICTSLSVSTICTTEQSGSGTIPIVTTMTITNDCTTIVAPDISFGSAPVISSFASVSQTINIICTKGSAYTVGLSNGSYAANGVRNMASGLNRLSYDIYKGTTSNRWGPSGSERWSSSTSTGVSADGVTRAFNYQARILTSQTTPPAGDYTDSVVVDLTF